MPSDVFWTGLFTFGGGLVGAAVSYATTHRQGDLQEQQLGLEEERHEAEVQSANRQHQERLLESRRALYLRYLKAVDEIIHLPNSDLTSSEELGRPWTEFMQMDNELELSGSDGVRELSVDLFGILNEIAYRFTEILESDSKAWPEDASAHMREVEGRLREARQGMVSRMRDDLRSS